MAFAPQNLTIAPLFDAPRVHLHDAQPAEDSMITEFLVKAGERTKRLDAFLVSHERGVSRASLQRLIMAGRIRVNAHVTKPSQKIKPGDRITMDTPEPGPVMVNNRMVPLEILYEDEALLVVNKQAGVVVHPTSGNWDGTLLNGLLEHFRAKDNDTWPFHSLPIRKFSSTATARTLLTVF